MPTAYTSLLGLALPVTGELSGTWGDTVNNSITSLLDTSVAGTTNVSTDADVTLTTTTGASNTARQAILLFSGARTALRTVTAPAQSKIYTVINATTGGFSVKLVGAGPTTGVTIVAGESAVCAWNGSDFVKVSNTGGSASFVNLTASGTVTFTGLTASQAVFTNASDELVSNAITGTGNVVMSASPTLTGTIGAAAATLSGNLTLSGGTANGVTYLNGSKVVTSGSALTFDGTGLGIGTGTIPAGRKLVIDSGNIRLSNDYQIEWGGSTVGLYGNGSTNSLSFFANTSEQMRLTSTGLGIGTSSPAYKLDVNGQARLGGSTGLVFGVGTAFAGGQAEIYSTSTTPMGLGTTGAAVLRLYTNSTLQATLDTSGNLGLGVTPSAWSTAGNIQLPSLTLAGQDYSIGSNYYQSGGSRYISTARSCRLSFYDGQFAFLQAPSGTAGTVMSATQAMTLDASGNLGVGTTSPATRLEVNGVSEGEYFRAGGGTISARSLQFSSFTVSGLAGVGHQINVPNASGVLTFATGSTERARITSSGNFGIGETSPSNRLVVGSVSDASNFLRINSSTVQTVFGSDANGGYVGTDNSYALRFFTNNTERARIDSSGNLLVGTTTAGGEGWTLYPTGSGGGVLTVWNRPTTANTTTALEFRDGGTAKGSITYTNTATAFNTSSDYRLKNTIAPMTGALAKVALLKPCTYKWNADGSNGEGFIAHELAEVCPQAVTGEKDAVDAEGTPKYQGIDTSFLVATLTAAIQEQQEIINQLKARLDAANL